MSRETKKWYRNRVRNDDMWGDAKNRAYKRLKKWQCNFCTQRKHLEWHHVDYSHLGEKKEYKDIRLLCHPCHLKAHYILFFRLPLTPFWLKTRYYYLRLKKT